MKMRGWQWRLRSSEGRRRKKGDKKNKKNLESIQLTLSAVGRKKGRENMSWMKTGQPFPSNDGCS